MKDTSTTTRREFLLDSVLYGAVLWWLYRKLLFRCLPGRTYAESILLLLKALVGTMLLGNFVLFRRHRTGLALVSCLILPFGTYTLAAYWRTINKIYLLPLAIAGVFSVSCMLLLLCQKIRCSEHRWRILYGRLCQSIWLSCEFMALGMLSLLLVFFAWAIFRSALVESSVEAVSGINEEAYEQTMEEQMEILMQLNEEKWKKLSTLKKINTLQVVANLEAYTLGLPNELNVRASNLEGAVTALYSEATHGIVIDLDHLENDPVETVLRSIFHEAYHSYQNRMVDLYETVPPEMKRLQIFQNAAAYEKEFLHYEEGEENFEAYYEQKCETDARNYAEETVKKYYGKILQYQMSKKLEEKNY